MHNHSSLITIGAFRPYGGYYRLSAARRVLRQRCVALMTAALIPMAVSGCGGSNPGAAPSGIIVVPAQGTPTPTPPPTPTPTPTPTSSPTPTDPSCTVAIAVKRADRLTIRSAAGKIGIVAIGSSSTEGAYASSVAANYPSVLQSLLSQRNDLAAFIVYNKGVGGDTLIRTEARIEKDAISLQPQLIILQVGTNDSIVGPSAADMIAFTNRLQSLVARLKPISSVVLMNGQYYPDAPSNYEEYQAAIDEVSSSQNVAVFDRYAMMKNWIVTGKYSFKEILAGDRFHPNDFTYRCMGEIAAELVTTSVVR
jgi:acyl-CoA thioesterase-1